MRRARVPVNPEGSQPVAVLDTDSIMQIVLFENSTIAEERTVDDSSVDDSDYHFLYTNISEIQEPKYSESSSISNAMKIGYYIHNVLYIIGIISLFIFLLIMETDFEAYFNGDMFVLLTIIALGIAPEIFLHFKGKNHYTRMLIKKYSRDDPYTLEGKTWKDTATEKFLLAKFVLTWCVLTYYFPWHFSFAGICLGLFGALYILSFLQQAYANYKSDTIQVKLLTTAEFYEEVSKRRVFELEKEPTAISIEKIFRMRESQTLEFKSSIWASYRDDTGDLVTKANKNLKTEDSVIKTIAGFLNTEGGKLVIGIQERPHLRIVGIEADLPYSGKEKSIESFQNSLQELIRNATHSDTIVGTFVFIKIEPTQAGKKVCVIDVKQRHHDKWTWVDMKTIDGGKPAKEQFYVRSGPQTKRISSQESGHEWRSSSTELRNNWAHENEEEIVH